MTILLVVLFLLALAALPTWPYAAAWSLGYWPSGLLALLFVVLLIAAFSNVGVRRRDPLI